MRLLLLLICASGLGYAVDLRYWIEPCERPETKCMAYDPQMAQWALEDWARASGGKLKLEKTAFRSQANIRVHWVGANQGLYGEARYFQEDNLVGAEVYVDVANANRGDAMLRDTIVYLTCLHETGHAIGLAHTDQFADIMYSFQFGGDITEYFDRFRRKLSTRADIAKTSAISPNDRQRLLIALSRY